MIDSKRQITTLATDIKNVFQEKHGDKLDMLRLCSDQKDPLLHADKKPVLNISQDDFVGMFDMGRNHYFLAPDNLFRLGRYCELTTQNIIALMLKAIWESFLSDMAGFPYDPGLKLDSIIEDQDLIEHYISDFKPHLGKLFKLFKDEPDAAGETLTYDTVEFIIQDLLEGRHFLYENESLDQLYPGEDISEIKLLSKISGTQRDNYLKTKEIWLLKSSDLDDMLLLLERKKRVNLAIENKYYEMFGKHETDRSDLRYQIEKYTRVLKILEDHPDLNIREVLKMAQKEMLEAENKRSQIRNKIARSQNKMDFIFPEGTRTTATEEFKESYMQECKALLHKLFFMLHTDTCPGYEDLSPEKQTEINDLWLQVMKSTNEELFSYSPTMMLYSMPDFDRLESIYKKACRILEIDPDDFTIGNRLKFMIRKGSPFESIMEFLGSETEKLSLHLAHLEMVQNEYTNEDQAQVHRDALSDIREYESKLEKEISMMKSQIKEMKQEISATIPKIEM